MLKGNLSGAENTVRAILLLSGKTLRSDSTIEDAVNKFTRLDDVLSPDFLTDTIVVMRDEDVSLPSKIHAVLINLDKLLA
jgi:hypothetical protein